MTQDTNTIGAADLPAMVSKALREAYILGQRYWQQADSEYISQHKKADDTRAKFLALAEETCAALAAGQATAAQAAQPDKTYSDGTTATGPGDLPSASPNQQRAAMLIDCVEAMLGGANGPTIQLRGMLAAPAQPAPSGATEEVENLRKALVYVAFALHDTPQYMLAQGITLIDGDTVRVSRDGWTVEASVNPHRQPAPAGATPECLTCSDHGAVGNILTAEPCPDCTRLNTQPTDPISELNLPIVD